jgi:AraC-like DNA-binding protein
VHLNAPVIVALLPEKLLRHLQFVLSGRVDVVSVPSWREVRQYAEDRPVSLAVVDPTLAAAGGILEVQRMLSAFPSVPVIAYVPLTPVAFRAIAELSKVGLSKSVLYAHEDSADAFRAMLDVARAGTLTAHLLSGLKSQIDRLPLTLGKSVINLFEEPHRYQSAHDIAVSAKMPTSRLYRSFQVAGLASPKSILVAARLLRGFTYLSDPGRSVRGVSRKLGYTKPRIFTDQTFEVFGVNPSQLVSRFTSDTVVRTLLDWCLFENRRDQQLALR